MFSWGARATFCLGGMLAVLTGGFRDAVDDREGRTLGGEKIACGCAEELNADASVPRRGR